MAKRKSTKGQTTIYKRYTSISIRNESAYVVQKYEHICCEYI